MSRAKSPRLPVPFVSWDDCCSLFQGVTDYAIFMLDTGGLVATWNHRAENIHGYTADEILGAHFSTFYPADDVESQKPNRQLQIAAELGHAEDEGWRVRKDGVSFWAKVLITALRNEAGELCGFAKLTRDVTQQRLAQEKTRHAEERFHHLVDAATDYAIFMLDPQGYVTTWNAGAKKTKGYAAEEIIGKHFSTFYSAEDRASGKPERFLEMVRQHGRHEDESWRVRKDGSRFWANVIITALRNEQSEVIGLAKVTRDLSERRAAEEALRRSEERFRLLVETVEDCAIYMLDPDGHVTTWNRGAERMKGYKAAEILGSHFSSFFPEDVRRELPWQELATAREKGRFEDEGWRVRKDGTRFWAHVVVTAISGRHGEFLGFAKVTRDLTVARQAQETERTLFQEQAARAAAEAVATKAEQANRIKDEFLATVSHELRTPLNAIVGWAAILRERNLDPSLAKALEVIDRNARAQSKIIDDILDVSRIITGKLRVEPRATDLVAVASAAIEVVRPSAAAKEISISLEAPGEGCRIVGDPERLQQAVWNLLSNSVKFTNPRGSIRVTIRQAPSSVALVVTDTGQGIDPDFLPAAFDRFTQADASTTRRHAGLGLGLALVRHIAELHGGSVTVQSDGVGKGAAFTILLPVRAVFPSLPRDRIALDETSDAPTPVPEVLRGLRVLIVDDHADTRELLRDVLADAGLIVETAASASEGFQAFQRFRPEVLLSDIGMADEDGYSLMQRLRALGPEAGGTIPAIALTAYTRTEDRTKALAAGFTTHIGKPVSREILLAALAGLKTAGRFTEQRTR